MNAEDQCVRGSDLTCATHNAFWSLHRPACEIVSGEVEDDPNVIHVPTIEEDYRG